MSTKESRLLNCGAGEDSWESLGLQGDQTNQSEIFRNQFRIFIGKTDVEAEAPILWPPDAKSWLTGKDPNVGKNWGQEEKEMIEDEMAGWHRRLDGREFERTPGVGDGQGGMLQFMGSQRVRQNWATELNWTELMTYSHLLDHRKSKRVPEKHLFLLYWLCQSLWLCGSQ